MKPLSVRTREKATRVPGLRWWLAGTALALVASGGITWAATAPPVYRVWLNGHFVGANRDLIVLQEGLRAELDRQVNREIALEFQEGSWPYRLKDLGMTAAPEELPDALQQAVTAVPWHEQFPWSEPELRITREHGWDRATLEGALALVKATIEKEAVPASLQIVDRTPVITPEVVGATVEVQKVLEALQAIGDSERMRLPVTHSWPAVTKASLEAMRIKRLIAEWSTDYDPSIPRAENVEKAAQAFHGLMLKHGQILSYNDTVGPISRATGWQEAPVIVNGALVPGIGGGVCQVATTFYGAALRANLDIVERHPHQLPVPYIPASQDAAVAQGWEDFKIRNTTEGYLLIETESGGGRVTFRLYGDLPDDLEVKIESRVTGSRPFETKVVEDPALGPGQQVVKSAGVEGLTSEGYRLVYRGGVLVRRELLSRDSYLPTARIVLTGPPAAPPQQQAESPGGEGQ